MIQVKCKRKTQKETNLSGRRERKTSSALGWKIGTSVTEVQKKFSVFGKNGNRERERGWVERIKERDREQRKNGVAIGFCIFCSFVR